MKKLFFILFAFIFLTSVHVFAEDDLWDNFGGFEYSEQIPVTDEEFDSVVDKLKEKKYGKEKNKNMPKGESYRQSNETNYIRNVPQVLPVLCIPVKLQVNADSFIPVGHYQIVGEKINGEPVIKLYQSHYLIAQLNAFETLDDFNQSTINFVKLLPEEDNKVKIIFGNVDFNAYTILDTVSETEELY